MEIPAQFSKLLYFPATATEVHAAPSTEAPVCWGTGVMVQ